MKFFLILTMVIVVAYFITMVCCVFCNIYLGLIIAEITLYLVGIVRFFFAVYYSLKKRFSNYNETDHWR